MTTPTPDSRRDALMAELAALAKELPAQESDWLMARAKSMDTSELSMFYQIVYLIWAKNIQQRGG